MNPSLGTSRDHLREVLLQFLWRQWSALGVAGYTQTPDPWLIDPEALLLFSLPIARHDPRLFDEIIDWLQLNGSLISLQRLQALSKDHQLGDPTLLLPIAARGATADLTLLAADDFERVVAEGWSSDGSGLPYVYPDGTGGFSADGSAGSIEVVPDGANREVQVDGVLRRDVDVRFRVTLAEAPTADGLWLTTVARHTEHGELRARLRFLGDGRILVGITRVRGTNLVNLGESVLVRGIRAAAGTALEVRVRVAGTDPTFVGVKVWPTGTVQPTAWLVAASRWLAGWTNSSNRSR